MSMVPGVAIAATAATGTTLVTATSSADSMTSSGNSGAGGASGANRAAETTGANVSHSSAATVADEASAKWLALLGSMGMSSSKVAGESVSPNVIDASSSETTATTEAANAAADPPHSNDLLVSHDSKKSSKSSTNTKEDAAAKIAKPGNATSTDVTLATQLATQSQILLNPNTSVAEPAVATVSGTPSGHAVEAVAGATEQGKAAILAVSELQTSAASQTSGSSVQDHAASSMKDQSPVESLLTQGTAAQPAELHKQTQPMQVPVPSGTSSITTGAQPSITTQAETSVAAITDTAPRDVQQPAPVLTGQAGVSQTHSVTSSTATAKPQSASLSAASRLSAGNGSKQKQVATPASEDTTAASSVDSSESTTTSEKAITRATTHDASERAPSEQSVHSVNTNLTHGGVTDAVAASVVRDSSINAAHSNTSIDHPEAASVTSGGSAQAAFTALDSASPSTAAAWTRTNAHAAEAGYQDPALGWVSVRAQQDTTGLHATVVPVSQDAAQSLGTHLAGLQTYLSEHRTPVDSLTIASPDASASGFNLNQGTNSQSGQNHSQQSFASGAEPSVDRSAVTTLRALQSVDTSNPPVAHGGGQYISVLA
jgi:hypothetical protein